MKNRDLTFVIKVQNQARAALRGLREDLGGTGRAGETTAQKLDRLRKSILAAAAAARRAIRVNVSGGSAGGARSARSGAGAGDGGATRALGDVAAAATAAARALREIRTPRGGGAGGGGGPGGSAGAAAGAAAAARTGNLGALLSVGAVTAASAAYVQFADTFKNLQARISLVTKDSEQQAVVFDRVFDVANRSRQSLSGTTELYTKLARAGKNLGMTQNEVVSITETVAKAISVSGASAAAADAAILQLGQGLASGVLRGEEFNSVVEQTPALAEAIARGLGVTSVGALRALANEGKLTADEVIKALVSQKAEVERQFGAFPVTVGQAFTVLKNSVLRTIGEIDSTLGSSKGLSDFFIQLAETIRSPAFREGLQTFLSVLGQVLSTALTITSQFVSFFVTNFETIKGIVLAVGPALLAFKVNALAAAGGTGALARAASIIVGPLRSIIMLGNPFRLIALGARGVVGLFAAISNPAAALSRVLLLVRSGALAAATGMRALAAAAIANPFTAVAVAIGAVVALMLLLKDRTVEYGGESTTVGDIMSEVFDRVLGVIQSVVDWISNAVNTVVSFFSDLVGASNDGTTQVSSGWATAINFIIKAVSVFATVWATVMKAALGALGNLGKALVLLVTGDFQGAAAAAGAAMGSIVGSVKDGSQQIGKIIASDPFGDIFKGAAGRTKARAKEAGKGAGTAAGGAMDEAMGTALANGGKADAGGKKAGESAADKAAKEFADRMKSLQSTFDPIVAKTKEFAADQAFLDRALGMSAQALEKFGFTQADVTRIAEGLARKRAEELDVMFEANRAVKEATRLLGVDVDLREDEQKIIDLENRARDQNTKLTREQTAAYREQLAVLRASRAADEAKTSMRNLSFELDAQEQAVGLLGRAQERSVELATMFGALQRAGVKNAMQLVAQYDRLLQRQDAIAVANDFNQRITALDTEIRLAGVLNTERERASAILEYQNYLQAQGLLNTAKGTELVTKYTEALDLARAAQEAARGDAILGIRDGLAQVAEEFTNFRQQAQGLVTDVFQSLSDSLVSFLETGKLGVSDLLRSITGGLARMGVNALLGGVAKTLGLQFGNSGNTPAPSVLDQMLLTRGAIPVLVTNATGASDLLGGLLGKASNDNPVEGATGKFEKNLDGSLQNIVSKTGEVGANWVTGLGGALQGIINAIGGGGSGIGSIVGTVLGSLLKFKDGGIMTEHGSIPLRKYSRGGVANSPQLAMFGEGSTPEAYVPVPSGRIPVELNGLQPGGGNTVVISPNVTVQVPGAQGGGGPMSPEEQANIAKALEDEMGKMLERWVQRETKPGGRLAGGRR